VKFLPRLFRFAINPIHRISPIGLIGLIGLIAVFASGAKTASASGLVKPPNNLGLVGYWSFEDGRGSKATDFSGHGNNGTLTNGPVWTSGKIGKGVSFDANVSGQQVIETSYTVPALSTSDNFTWSTWVYLRSAPYGGATIIGNRANGTQVPLQFIELTPTYFYVYQDGYNGTIANTLPLGVWTHVAVVKSSSTFTYYQNAVSKGTGNQTVNEDSNPFYIGGDYDNQGAIDGVVDEVRLYNRALSATEVAALYNASLGSRVNTSVNSRGPQNGLVGQWSFDGQDISGTTAYDRSGQGNNGTLTNGPATTIGKLGQALDFTGASRGSQTVESSSTPFNFGTGSFSVSLWAKYPTQISGDNNYPGLVNKSDSVGAGYQMYVSTAGTADNNKVVFGINDGTDSAFAQTDSAKNDNLWHHYLGLVDRTNQLVKLYVDSELQSGGTPSTSAVDTLNNAYNFLIGNRNSTGSINNPLYGAIDDVRIYNRALSAAEIAELYNLGTATKVNAPQNTRGPQTGLVGLWTYNGKDVSGTTAYDRGTSGKNGTITNGAALVPGKQGQGILFDGVDDRVYCLTGNPVASTTGSMGAWVYPMRSSPTAGEMMLMGSRQDDRIYMYRDATTGNLTVNFGSSGAKDSGVVVRVNEWSHVLVTWNVDTYYLYLNGVQVDTDTYAGLTGITDNFTVGSHSDSGSSYKGIIDEVRVYNRALSAAEVLQLYNMSK